MAAHQIRGPVPSPASCKIQHCLVHTKRVNTSLTSSTIPGRSLSSQQINLGNISKVVYKECVHLTEVHIYHHKVSCKIFCRCPTQHLPSLNMYVLQGRSTSRVCHCFRIGMVHIPPQKSTLNNLLPICLVYQNCESAFTFPLI